MQSRSECSVPLPGDYVTDTEKGTLEPKARQHAVDHHSHYFSTKSLPPEYTFIILRRESLQLSRHLLIWLLLPPTLLSLVFSGYFFCRESRGGDSLDVRPKDSDYYDAGASFAPFKTQRLWGSYSPYYSVEEYKPPPNDCQLTQVNIIQRHGARYPTFGLAIHMAQALLRLQAAESYMDRRLLFITDYEYDLDTDDLLPFGEYQTYESGRKSFLRYSTLATKHNLPFVRASGSDRVVQSALKWIEGFSSGSNGTLQPSLALVFPEIEGYNNTLEDKSCPNAGHPFAPVQEWQSIYAKPIANRLNIAAQGMPENLTAEDAQSLIALCALETVAKEEYSRFCDIFNEEEFNGYEYAIDLDKFYFTGYGARLGPVQGVGYINELLARLTDQPIQDRTQTNHTLDSNPDSFPLGRGIYIDFSHDNLMVAAISAMGMFSHNGADHTNVLDPRKCNKYREWYMSRVVPFSGKMVVERMECGSSQIPNGAVRGSSQPRQGKRRRPGGGSQSSVYVRVLVNDAVQKLVFCNGVDEDGLCPLEAFVESQGYARESGDGDWEKCFE